MESLICRCLFSYQRVILRVRVSLFASDYWGYAVQGDLLPVLPGLLLGTDRLLQEPAVLRGRFPSCCYLLYVLVLCVYCCWLFVCSFLLRVCFVIIRGRCSVFFAAEGCSHQPGSCRKFAKSPLQMGGIKLGWVGALPFFGAPAQKEPRSSSKGPKPYNYKTRFPPQYET